MAIKPLRKPFERGDRFPFRLVYQDTESPQTELPDHLHDGYELVFVYAGFGTLFINHAFYDMRPGDLFLIPDNTIHRAFPDADTPVTSTAVFFSPALLQPLELGETYAPLRSFDYAKKQRGYKLETEGSVREAVARLLEDMHRELAAQQPGYRHAVLNRLHDLLLTLNRMAAPSGEDAVGDSRVEPAWMRKTLSYIDANVGSPELKLSSLSRRVSITPSHFSNAASDDYVDMPQWYMDELKEHVRNNRKMRMQSLDKWQGGDRKYVFHSGLGKPYYHTTPTQRWQEWCKRNGFRNVSLHGLRHTNATYLLSQGATIKEIQHRLRHSNAQITTDTYAHITKRLSKRTVSHLDKFAPNSVPNPSPMNKFDTV